MAHKFPGPEIRKSLAVWSSQTNDSKTHKLNLCPGTRPLKSQKYSRKFNL